MGGACPSKFSLGFVCLYLIQGASFGRLQVKTTKKSKDAIKASKKEKEQRANAGIKDDALWVSFRKKLRAWNIPHSTFVLIVKLLGIVCVSSRDADAFLSSSVRQ